MMGRSRHQAPRVDLDWCVHEPRWARLVGTPALRPVLASRSAPDIDQPYQKCHRRLATAQSYTATTSTTLNGDLTGTAAGAFSFTGPVILGADVVMTTFLGATDTITFGSGIDGAHSLTFAVGAGSVTVAGDVGGSSAPSDLILTSDGTVSLNNTVSVNGSHVGNLTINGGTFNNNTGAFGLTVNGAFAINAGSFVQQPNVSLSLLGSSANAGTFDAHTNANTVAYADQSDSSGGQTPLATVYYNLQLSGIGTMAMPTGLTTISHSFSIGTTTYAVTAGDNLTVGSFTQNGSGTFDAHTFTVNVSRGQHN